VARKTYEDQKFHCIVCTKEIDDDRALRNNITCSEACLTLRKSMQRAKRDAVECRYCKKPSTMEQRAAFTRFRRVENKRPDLLYPQEYEAWMRMSDDGSGNYVASPEAFAKYREEQGLYVAHPWLEERNRRIEQRKQAVIAQEKEILA
jgi:hypothetical protein